MFFKAIILSPKRAAELPGQNDGTVLHSTAKFPKTTNDNSFINCISLKRNMLGSSTLSCSIVSHGGRESQTCCFQHQLQPSLSAGVPWDVSPRQGAGEHLCRTPVRLTARDFSLALSIPSSECLQTPTRTSTVG